MVFLIQGIMSVNVRSNGRYKTYGQLLTVLFLFLVDFKEFVPVTTMNGDHSLPPLRIMDLWVIIVMLLARRKSYCRNWHTEWMVGNGINVPLVNTFSSRENLQHQ